MLSSNDIKLNSLLNVMVEKRSVCFNLSSLPLLSFYRAQISYSKPMTGKDVASLQIRGVKINLIMK